MDTELGERECEQRWAASYLSSLWALPLPLDCPMGVLDSCGGSCVGIRDEGTSSGSNHTPRTRRNGGGHIFGWVKHCFPIAHFHRLCNIPSSLYLQALKTAKAQGPVSPTVSSSLMSPVSQGVWKWLCPDFPYSRQSSSGHDFMSIKKKDKKEGMFSTSRSFLSCTLHPVYIRGCSLYHHREPGSTGYNNI